MVVEIKNSDPAAAELFKKHGINHNLRTEDIARFHGTIEAPVRISETRIFHTFSFGAFSYVSGGFLYDVHVGRYCSLSNGLHIGQGNHPMDWLSSHPFQYQNLLFAVGEGFPDRDIYRQDVQAVDKELSRIVPKPVKTYIGNDVWLGHGVIAVNGVRIGDGCVVGGGSVVTKDLEPYSIAVGNPARVLKKRFPDPVIEKLLDLKFWDFAPWQLRHIKFNEIDRSLDQLAELRSAGAQPYEPHVVTVLRA